MIETIEIRSTWRTTTSEGGVIEDESSRAGDTSMSASIPDSWNFASNAVVSSIDMVIFGGADTDIGSSIPDVIGGAMNAYI